MHRVRDHRAGTGQLALVPRRLIMLRDEAHRVEEREAQHRTQHQRQGLVEHAMTICPGQQHAVNDDLEQGFTDMDRPVAAIELADRIQQIEVQEAEQCAGGDITVEQHERSEEHTSELQSLMRISYAVFCLKKKKKK